MKNLCLCLLVLVFYSSCDDSSAYLYTTNLTTNANAGSTLASRSGPLMPENMDNPYDYSGQLFLEILSTYYESNSKPTDMIGIVARIDSIAQQNPGFKEIKPAFYHAPSLERIQYFIMNKKSCLETVVDSSGVSAIGQLSLIGFIDTYLTLCSGEESYEVVHEFVIAYEKDIIANSLLSVTDKQVILVTTSIARHSAATKKKRPKKNTDPLWDLLICTVYGSIENAKSSPAEAVTLALASGIVEHLSVPQN